MSDENPYATVVGLCRGLEAIFFFLDFFGAGPVRSEDPAREDSAAARFRGGPVGPLARGGTSRTWPPESADRKSTRLNSSHSGESRMPSSA